MLSNKFIFGTILILFIAILTTINNYYFYAHIERENIRSSERVQHIVDGVVNLCKKNNITTQICNQQIIDIIKEVSQYEYYLTSMEIFDFNNKELWSTSINEHDKVTQTYITVTLPDLKLDNHVIYNINNKWSNVNVILSVYKSMTFSMVELIHTYGEQGYQNALERFKTVAWYRSRPAIGFTIFSFVLLWVYRKREKDVKEKKIEYDERLEQTFKENTKLLFEKAAVEAKYNEVFAKLQNYDYIINPPINTLKFEDLISIDTSGLGNKFRKTLEKLIFPIFQYHMNYKNENLGEVIYKLNAKQIISNEFANCANVIRVYGNIDSHYNEQKISKEEILALTNYLIFIVEEIIAKDFLNIHITQDVLENITTNKATGLRIKQKFNQK